MQLSLFLCLAAVGCLASANPDDFKKCCHEKTTEWTHNELTYKATLKCNGDGSFDLTLESPANLQEVELRIVRKGDDQPLCSAIKVQRTVHPDVVAVMAGGGQLPQQPIAVEEDEIEFPGQLPVEAPNWDELYTQFEQTRPLWQRNKGPNNSLDPKKVTIKIDRAKQDECGIFHTQVDLCEGASPGTSFGFTHNNQDNEFIQIVQKMYINGVVQLTVLSPPIIIECNSFLVQPPHAEVTPDVKEEHIGVCLTTSYTISYQYTSEPRFEVTIDAAPPMLTSDSKVGWFVDQLRYCSNNVINGGQPALPLYNDLEASGPGSSPPYKVDSHVFGCEGSDNVDLAADINFCLQPPKGTEFMCPNAKIC